jgi:hypothetical protein
MFIEATSDLASRVTGAIRSAAQATGANFEYLLKTAQRESNLNPTAKASTSSASGLFQFIDQTWLQTLKTAGPSLGYGRYADGIVQTDSGRFVVPNEAQRKEIMQLRTDPAAASAMAGAFTQRNAAYLTERIGRQPTQGELYIAHFLGPSGAAQLITNASNNPSAKAANLFPTAARANRSIFYQRGQARSAAQVYNILVAKHQNTRTPATAPVTATAVADAAKAVQSQTAAAASSSSSPIPEASSVALAPRAAETGPVFHNLFRTGRDTPVSATVAELWSAKSMQAPEIGAAAKRVDLGATSAVTTRPPVGKPLQLFQFLRPEIRAQRDRSA